VVGAGPGGPVGDWKERTPFVAVDSYAIAFDAGVSLDVLARATQWGLLLMREARFSFQSPWRVASTLQQRGRAPSQEPDSIYSFK